MSDAAALSATLELKVDPKQINQELGRATATVQQRMRQMETAARASANQAMLQTTARISGQIKEASDKLAGLGKMGLGVGVGAGTSAVAAFLKSNTAEAQVFKARLSEVQTALGGVGQKLAFNVRFGGKSMYEWAEKLTQYLERLDVSQLQKAADIVTKIAIAVGALKTVSIGSGLVQSASNVAANFAGSSAKPALAQTAATAAGSSAVGAGIGTGVGLSTSGRLARSAGAAAHLSAAGIPRMTGFALAYGASMARNSGHGAVRSAVTGAGIAGGGLAKTLGYRATHSALSRLAGGLGVAGAMYDNYQRAGDYLEREQGYRPSLLGDDAGAGVLDSVWKYGLRRPDSNWFDRLFGEKDQPGFTNTEMQPGELAGLLAANRDDSARQALLKSKLFGASVSSAAAYQDLGLGYGIEDSMRRTPAKYADLKGRLPELRSQYEATATQAQEFQRLRDQNQIGSATYDLYNKQYMDAAQRGLGLSQQAQGIEAMGRDERRQKAASDFARSELTLDFNQSKADRALSERRFARDQAQSREDLQDGYEKSAKFNPSLGLGIGVDQIQNQISAALLEGDARAHELAEAQIELQKRLVELDEIAADRAEDVEKERKRSEETFLKQIQAIADALTGNINGQSIQ